MYTSSYLSVPALTQVFAIRIESTKNSSYLFHTTQLPNEIQFKQWLEDNWEEYTQDEIWNQRAINAICKDYNCIDQERMNWVSTHSHQHGTVTVSKVELTTFS